MVLISVYGMHHLEENWPRADQIDVTRFNSKVSSAESQLEGDNSKPGTWIPFSSGLRMYDDYCYC